MQIYHQILIYHQDSLIQSLHVLQESGYMIHQCSTEKDFILHPN